MHTYTWNLCKYKPSNSGCFILRQMDILTPEFLYIYQSSNILHKYFIDLWNYVKYLNITESNLNNIDH